VSRFSRAAGIQFHVWSPRESPLRIEYAAALFRELRLEGATGELYGLAAKTVVRVVTGAARAHSTDPRLAGLEPVGIFAVRDRGEVFLTESDLERFEKSEARVALVIAGERAGFFVRERDGSLQSVRSHQEIQAPAAVEPRRRNWVWLPALALAAVAIALGVAWSLREGPLRLAIHEEAGQLRIAWRPTSGEIEIVDGSHLRRVPIDAAVSGITYTPETADVQIRLRCGNGVAMERFVRPDPLGLEMPRVRGEIDALARQANELAAESSRRTQSTAESPKSLSTMKRAD
jgi:hypothetical protein